MPRPSPARCPARSARQTRPAALYAALAAALALLGLGLLGRSQASLTQNAPPSAPTNTMPNNNQTAASAAAPARVPVLRPQVVARFPHGATSFTEGFQYLGGGIYLESTGEVPGSSTSGVRRIELQTGRILREVATPLEGAFGEGVTVLDRVAYHLTWQNGVAFAFSMPGLRETGRFRYDGEGWGLTNDGKQIIMSNGSSTLVWRDPRTFAITRSLKVTDNGQPVRNLNELEYVQGSLYANIWLTDRIARIDPQSGKVTAWLDISALTREAGQTAAKAGRTLTFDDVANGIAYNPQRGTLYLTGKRWPTIFEVKLPDLKPE